MKLNNPLLACLLFIIFANQMATATTQYDMPKHPLFYGDLSSPRSTLQGFMTIFLEMMELRDSPLHQTMSQERRDLMVQRIMHHLDLSNVPPNVRLHRGKEAAVYLIEVLARISLPDFRSVPHQTDWQGLSKSGLPDTYKIPKTEIAITKIKDGEDKGQYRFSTETVDSAQYFYDHVKHLPYLIPELSGALEFFLTNPDRALLTPIADALPSFFHWQWKRIAYWQWLLMISTILLGLWAAALLLKLRKRMMKTIVGRTIPQLILWLAFAIGFIALAIAAKSFLMGEIRMTGGILELFSFIADLIVLILIAHAGVVLFCRAGEVIIDTPDIHPHGLNAQMVRLVSRLVALAFGIIIFLEGGQSLGIPITTLLAGAGVGGLALALAAQDSLRNILGSMMITLDKPYQVGEMVKIKGYTGRVEQIGLRSTRLRLLTGHLVTIPNVLIAANDIENIGRRPFIRMYFEVQTNNNAPIEKTMEAVELIRELLRDHEGMLPEYPAKVYLSDITRDWYSIKVYCWFTPAEYFASLAFSEKFISNMMTEFKKRNIQLAIPTNKTFIEQVPHNTESK